MMLNMPIRKAGSNSIIYAAEPFNGSAVIGYIKIYWGGVKMFRYILKRLGYMLLTLWIVITITFALMHTIPGDPLASSAKRLPPQIRANYYAKYGLDKPLTTQYAVYMKNLLKGDLGDSLAFAGRSVNTVIKDGLPASARIGIQAVFLGFTLGIILGVVAAFKRNKWPDYIVMF